jgi:hypothetical protein
MNGWEADWNRGMLERIVALLFALANLADLAADAPFLRRRRVLAILNWGEAEARAFVIKLATGVPVAADALEPTDDAVHLATRLRALALMLGVLLAQAPPAALPGMAGPRAHRPPHEISGPVVRRLDAPAPPGPDTS